MDDPDSTMILIKQHFSNQSSLLKQERKEMVMFNSSYKLKNYFLAL